MKALLLLAALCALAYAQVPTIQQNTQSFPQNGGILTVFGTGFVQRNLDQFAYTLVTGATGQCAAGCRFFCHYRSMVVNPAGTIAYCEVPYIPDGVLGAVGSNYITLKTTNQNGASNTVTVATVAGVTTVVTPSTGNVIPTFTTGITITGQGLPSENSLFNQFVGGAAPVPAYTLTLTDNVVVAPIVIDLLGSRSGAATLTATPMGFAPFAGANNQPPANNRFCRWNQNQIDCWYISQGAAPGIAWNVNQNQNGLFATLKITQPWTNVAAVTNLNTDTVGPVQIGVVSTTSAPTITPVLVIAPWAPSAYVSPTDPFITIQGTNFLQYPVTNANIFYPAQTGGNQRLRCDTVSATATSLTCALTPRSTEYLATALTAVALAPASAQITGQLVSGSNLAPGGAVPVAIVNTAAATGFKFPINAATGLPDPTQTPIPWVITPDDQPIQQDALTLTIRSSSGSFYPPDIPFLYQYSLASAAASAPVSTIPSVSITGIKAAGAITCTAIYPDQVEPNTITLNAAAFQGAFTVNSNGVAGQSPVGSDVCTIISMDNSKIVVRLPGQIDTPLGTIVTATVLAVDSAAATEPPMALQTRVTNIPVGIIAPGAGVGGDPHFFGFLGEKYEFAGEAGRVYNLLSDEGIQLNAEIGYWHWNRGKETIIRKLALKTNDHRLMIDAGGNHLGTEGFSISVDGASIPPSRIRQTYLGTDGWVRWYPLTADDKFRLPLWERHQGVALIEIVLNDYKFQVLAVEEGKDKDGVWHKQPSRFLDFMAEMLTDRRPHGLFGQSAHLRAGQRSANDFAIEGEGNDYEVSNLFGDDFTFNKFNARK